MPTLIGGIARWAAWFALLVVVTMLALAAVNWLPGKVRSAYQEGTRLAEGAARLAEGTGGFADDAGADARAADAEIERIGREGAAALDGLERDLTARLDATNAAAAEVDTENLAFAVLRHGPDAVRRDIRLETVDRPLTERALTLVRARRWNLNLAGQQGGLNQDIAAYNRRLAVYRTDIARLDAARQAAASQRRNPVCARASFLPGCARVRAWREMEAALAPRGPALERERRILEARAAAMARAGQMSEAIADSRAIVAAAIDRYGGTVSALATEAQSRASNQVRGWADRYFWRAVLIVLGVLASPVLIKAIAFFLIAPLARRAAPIRLEAATAPMRVGPSRASIEVPVDAGHELYVRGAVQGSGEAPGWRGVGLLDWRMPLTCLAAGLANMQRFRPASASGVRVTATGDAHHEVALVEVPAGGAVTIRPRAIVAVAKPRGTRLAIERRWQLNRLIAWITAQFRYLIVRGPCTLVVQGRRGVEWGDAAGGRMIDRRLVLGFDAGLEHFAARSGTFSYYLQGRQGLFLDGFAGSGGYLFEQREAGAGGPVRRVLKGLGDAALNAFGV